MGLANNGQALMYRAGDGVNRVWAIYNRNYQIRCIVAADREAAIQLAHKAGHMRHPSYIRRAEDVTEAMLERHGIHIQELLDGDITGAIEQDGEVWRFRG